MKFDDVKVAYDKLSRVWSIMLPENTPGGNEDTRFVFVCPFRNAGQFISLNAYSILSQEYSNYEVHHISDCSTDDSISQHGTMVGDDEKFNITSNESQLYALHNIVNAIDNADLNDEDVIILLDGDDWLPCPHVLSYLNSVYTVGDCWMTYGSYCFFPFSKRGVEPSQYPQEVIDYNLYRQDLWRASHLRTFKYGIWKNINKADLQVDGSYFKFAYDQAIMLPLLEMSGERAKYIDKTLHVYNRSNPGNVDKTHAQEQTAIANYVRSLPPYERLS